MKSTYVHVGTYSQILDTPYEFKFYGQVVEIEDELAVKCTNLIPKADFDALGHDPVHLKKFNKVNKHRNAPPEFITARNKAWALAQSRSAAAQAPVPEPSLDTPEEPMIINEEGANDNGI